MIPSFLLEDSFGTGSDGCHGGSRIDKSWRLDLRQSIQKILT
jgi:hypothetical protein